VLLSLKGRVAVGMDVGYDEIKMVFNIQFRMVGTYDLQKTVSE
jgi:Tfp pilus assembly PilM family ATPase